MSQPRGGANGLEHVAILAILALIIVGASLAWATPSNGQAAVTSTYTGSTIDTVPLPCGSPGVICGGSKVSNASLVAYENGSSVLTITVLDTGSGNPPPVITLVQVNLNTPNLPIGSASTHLEPGSQTTIRFSIALSAIQAGKSYTFNMEAWDGASTDSGSSFTVIATQQAAVSTNAAGNYLLYGIVIIVVAVALSAAVALLQYRKSTKLRSRAV